MFSLSLIAVFSLIFPILGCFSFFCTREAHPARPGHRQNIVFFKKTHIPFWTPVLHTNLSIVSKKGVDANNALPLLKVLHFFVKSPEFPIFFENLSAY